MLLTMSDKEASICEVCLCKITDRFYLQVGTKKLHNKCLKCRSCAMSLSSDASCYEKNEHIFCRTCYFKLFSIPNCLGCCQEISTSDFVMQAKKTYYHVNCFRCSTCSILLQKGDKYGIRNHQLFCEQHYLNDVLAQRSVTAEEEQKQGYDEKSVQADSKVSAVKKTNSDQMSFQAMTNNCTKTSEPLQLPFLLAPLDEKIPKKQATPNFPCNKSNREKNVSTFSSSAASITLVDKTPESTESKPAEEALSRSVSSSNSSGDDDKPVAEQSKSKRKSRSKDGKPKRVRTTFKHFQLLAMKDLFDVEKNPDSNALQTLSEKVGLTKRVLQVWFQNARAKHRKGLCVFSDTVLKTSVDEPAEKMRCEDDVTESTEHDASTVTDVETPIEETSDVLLTTSP